MAIARVVCEIPAAMEAVFGRLADHAHYDQLPSVSLSKLLREGRETRNGLGAVRELNVSVIRFIEDITAYQPPRLLEYRVRACYLRFGRSGWQIPFPLIHQLGRITLVETASGTQIDWLSQFTVKLPFGELIAKCMRPLVERTFARILKEIEHLLIPSSSQGSISQ